VFNDLRTRGVEDVLIAVVDGLKGFPEAIEAVFPKTTVQTCVVHLIRNSLGVVSHKDRQAVAAALRPIYTALNDEVAALWKNLPPAPGVSAIRRSPHFTTSSKR